jgi:hypothetical protein
LSRDQAQKSTSRASFPSSLRPKDWKNKAMPAAQLYSHLVKKKYGAQSHVSRSALNKLVAFMVTTTSLCVSGHQLL